MGSLTTHSRHLVLFGVTLVLFYVAWTVFGTMPFLQQEVIGHANWWNHPSLGFFQTLFDQNKMDAHPGRFRYVNYLVEAVYWKIYALSVMPKDFYDFLSLGVSALLAFLTFTIAKRRGLSTAICLLLAGLLLLSAHTYLLAVYHHRKAKYLISLLLVLLLGFRKLNSTWSTTVLGTMGVLTDPTFIVLAPILTIILDWHLRTVRFLLTRYLLIGFFLGALLVVLLNGFIGPLFNSTCQLFPEISNRPFGLLNFGSIPLFFDILPDLFLPNLLNLQPSVGWVLMAIYWVIAFMLLLQSPRRYPFLLAFVVGLPIFAFLVRPASFRNMYTGYYGHPAFVLFVLSWIDIFLAMRKNRWATAGCALLLLVSITAHQLQKKTVFNKMARAHVYRPSTLAKYVRDYRLIKELGKNLRRPLDRPYQLQLDYSNLKEALFDGVYEYGETGKERKHTLIAYVMLPLIFRNEIESGQLVIRNTK